MSSAKGRPTRLGWHGNSGPLGDRPEQRLNKAPFDELKNIPLPGYWLQKGFTLGDLANILTLISSTDTDTALGFLAELHYFFQIKRDDRIVKTGMWNDAHIKTLLADREQEKDFFFAVKCVLKGHESSMIHSAVIDLLADFSFITEKEFGKRIDTELSVLFAYDPVLTAPIGSAIRKIIIPGMLNPTERSYCHLDPNEDFIGALFNGMVSEESIKKEKGAREELRKKRESLEASAPAEIDKAEAELDMKFCERLVVLILMIDDKLKGADLWHYFHDRQFAEACRRIIIGKSKADKEMAKNKQLVLRFMSIIARHSDICQMFEDLNIHKDLIRIYKERVADMAATKQVIECDAQDPKTLVVTCFDCIMYEFIGSMAAHSGKVSALVADKLRKMKQDAFDRCNDMSRKFEPYGPPKNPLDAFFKDLDLKEMQDEITSQLMAPHLSAMIYCVGGLLVSNPNLFVDFILDDMGGRKDIKQVANWLRSLFFCACVENEAIGRIGSTGVKLLLLTLKNTRLNNLTQSVYQLLDGKLLMQCATELASRYNEVKKRREDASLLPTDFELMTKQMDNIARRLVSMLECIAMYNHDPVMSAALQQSEREAFVLGLFHKVDDDQVKFAVAKVLESVPVPEFTPVELELFLKNLSLPRTSPIVNRVLASLFFVMYKMAVVAFDGDKQAAGSTDKWPFASEFRTEFFPKMLTLSIDQFKKVAVEQSGSANKELYEQALMKFLELTFEFPETRHMLLVNKQYVIYPSLGQLLKQQQKAGDMVDDRSFYPEMVLAGWNVDFATNVLQSLSEKGKYRSKFRALHHIANSITGIHRLDTVQRLRTLVRQSPLDGSDFHAVNISFSIQQLLQFESEMWPLDPYGYTSVGVPPQQSRVPCAWYLEEPDDCLGSAEEDRMDREALAHECASLHIACYRSVFQGTRADKSFSARKAEWSQWLDALAAEDDMMTWSELTKPWMDAQWVLNKDKRRGNNAGDDEEENANAEVDEDEDDDDQVGGINKVGRVRRVNIVIPEVTPIPAGDEDDEDAKTKYRKSVQRREQMQSRLKQLTRVRILKDKMRGVLAHEPWTHEEELKLRTIDEAVKADVGKLKKKLIEQQSAHMVNCFEESFHTQRGPTKVFFLRAEGEMVGFIVGGPALMKDEFEEDVVEIYALHVLPTYAHFAEFYLTLWRAFALWAQRVTWKKDDEDPQAQVYRYKRGIFFAAELHPAVSRLFCKHPIMSTCDHPEIDAMADICLPHRCYTWDSEKVRRIEPWEISQTEHAACVHQFLDKNGLPALWKLLADSSDWRPEEFHAVVDNKMEDFGQKLYNSLETLVDKPTAADTARFDGVEGNFFDILIEDYVNPNMGPTKPNILPSLLFALPSAEFDLMLTSAKDQHDKNFAFVDFHEDPRARGLQSAAAGTAVKISAIAQQRNNERLGVLSAILRILFGLLRYGDRPVRQLVLEDSEGQNGLLDARIMHLIMFSCAKEDFGLSADESKQKFAIPFKLLAIIEELIHIPTYSALEAKRMINLCEVVLGFIGKMMSGVMFLLARRADAQRSGLVSSEHPTQNCCAQNHNPFKTNPFSSAVGSYTPDIANGKANSYVGSTICTCLMCAMRYMVSVASQVSHVVQNLNFFEYSSPVLELEHELGYELDTRWMANVLCRREASRLLFKPSFLKSVMDFLEVDLKLASGLFALNLDDPLASFQRARVASTSATKESADHADKDDEEDQSGKIEPIAPYVATLTSALTLRSDACSLWADYLKTNHREMHQQFLEYNYALAGPDGDRALALRSSFMTEILAKINRINVGVRTWFERGQIREMQQAMFRREEFLKDLADQHEKAHLEMLHLDSEVRENIVGLTQAQILDQYPPPALELDDGDIEELPVIPDVESILACFFVEVRVAGGFVSTAQLEKRLMICTNYHYYVSKQAIDTDTFDRTGYSSARILKAFAERVTYRRAAEVERLEMMGDDAEFENIERDSDLPPLDESDPDTLPYVRLSTRQKLVRDAKDEAAEMRFSKDEESGEALMNLLNGAMERRSYHRIVQVVRGLHGQTMIIQRYAEKGDTEILNEVFWTGSMATTERLLFAFAKNSHQWDSSPSTTMWESHMPAPMAIAPDHFTSVELSRILKSLDVENATIKMYTACGLMQKPISMEKSPTGTRQRTVLVLVDKSSPEGQGASSSDEGVVPGSELDCMFLHEQFFDWGNATMNYYIEPPKLLHWTMSEVTNLKPMPAPMEAKLSAGFTDVDWYASALPEKARFFLTTAKQSIRLDFPDETARESIQRLIGRFLLAKAAAKKPLK